MTDTPSYDIDYYHMVLEHIGYSQFVQTMIDNTLKSLHTIRKKSIKHKDRSEELAKAKLKVFLLLLKRSEPEVFTAINEFKEIASSLLTDVMENKLGNVKIKHNRGFYFNPVTKLDEQSRQVARSLKTSVDVMEFLISYMNYTFVQF